MTVKTESFQTSWMDGWITTDTGINNVTPRYVSWSRSRSGDSNPKWRADIRRGANATTPLSGYIMDVFIKPGDNGYTFRTRSSDTAPWRYYQHIYKGSIYDHTVPLPISNHYLTDKTQEANAAAVKKLYRKVNKVRTQFAGGVFLGEFHKTVSMIARPALALQKGVKQYLSTVRKMKRTMSSAKLFSKALAGTYLEYVYGWQPLMADIEDAAKAIKRMTDKENRLRITAHAEVLQKPQDPAYVAYTIWWGRFVRERRYERTDKVIYYGRLKETALKSMKQDTIQRVIDLSGFSWRDFAPTIWELVPYSFLVDYFTNIGDLILAATTDKTIISWLTKVSITETRQISRHYLDTAATEAAMYVPNRREFTDWQLSDGITVGTYRTVTRTPMSAMPEMQFTFESPSLWSKQMLNIAALLVANGGRGTYRL